MRRHGIRDDQWERIRDLLPGQEGHVGVTAADNRLFVEAVLYRYRTSMPWRDLPERCGDWTNVHQRFGRWAKSGVWEKVFLHLSADADNAFDADERVIAPLAAAGKTSVIPPKTNRRLPRDYAQYIYQARHLIENFFAVAIATRYDNCARNFLAAIHLTAGLIWLN